MRKTIILKYKNVLNDDKREQLEKEYSKKLGAKVVILDARFENEIIKL